MIGNQDAGHGQDRAGEVIVRDSRHPQPQAPLSADQVALVADAAVLAEPAQELECAGLGRGLLDVLARLGRKAVSLGSWHRGAQRDFRRGLHEREQGGLPTLSSLIQRSFQGGALGIGGGAVERSSGAHQTLRLRQHGLL